MTRIQTVRDETRTLFDGMSNALLHRSDPTTFKLDGNGRRHVSQGLLELGRELMRSHGFNPAGMDRLQLSAALLSRGGMHTSADFPALLANVANKRLRAAFEQAPSTYRLWARRGPDLQDFKPVTAVSMSAMPDLLQVNEAGEFKYGTISDGAETYAATTFGRMLLFSRQALINDDLRAFERMAQGFGAAAARLENRLVYAQLTGNPTLSDNLTLFHASHGNVGTGAGSALQASALVTGRAALRTQVGMQGEALNLAPAFLLVPAALEQTAYQLTSSQYVPAKATDVSEFRAGGRTPLTPIVEPLLDSVNTATWYLAAASNSMDTVEYAFLAGQDGPVLEEEPGFDVDGLKLKCRHDFACKAIEYRGLYRAAGT